MLKHKDSHSSTLALALLLLLTIDSFTTTTAFWPFKKKYTTVQINNWLVSKAGLQVHCKDKHDHDIGAKQLAYLELFSFKFVPPFMLVAEYFCDFTWNGMLQSFNIYVQTRDQEVCGGFCDWIVVESGPCLHNPENDKYNKCYHWDVKSSRRPLITSYPLSGLVNQTNVSTMKVKGGVGHVP